MKILIINSVIGFGSTGRICSYLGKLLKNKGHEVKIAYGRKPVLDEECLGFKISTDIEVYLHLLGTRLTDRHGFFSKKSTKNFIKCAEEFDPDLVWIHNVHGYYLNVELLFDWLKKKKNIKKIWTFHDCWPFTGHCVFLDCDGWKNGCLKCSSNSYPKSFVKNSRSNFIKKREAFTGVENLKIVSPSYWLSDLISQTFLKTYPIYTIHNGINLSSFKNKTFLNKNITNDTKYILSVSSIWTKEKGIEDLIKLSKMLEPNYKIIILGKTPRKYIVDSKQIIFIKRTNNVDELNNIYCSADVFLNPTYQDNYPTVNLEALASGLPVVSYKTGGSCELIDSNFAIEQGDISMAYFKIKELFENKVTYKFPLYEELAKETMIKKYLEIIEDFQNE